MAGTPRVQLSLKGRLLSEVPFEGAALRIGRMRENDIVVNNLAVSRFHATLRREGDDFVLEDLGSENGTQLNGVRISGSAPMAVTDVVQLGKYELKIVMEPSNKVASASPKKRSDAWDASQTYLALGDPPHRAQGKGAGPASAAPVSAATVSAPPLTAAPVSAAPLAAPAQSAPAAAEAEPAFDFSANAIAPAELAPELTESDAAPDPDGVFAFGEDDLGGSEEAPSALGPRDMETAPLAPPTSEHTALFDFGAHAAPARSAPAPNPETPAAEERLHAGLIVQRDGKLHELRAWDGDELCAGRAPECEVVLSDAGVSRRHAAFERAGGAYEVRDLGSVNGIYVNGQRTKRHVLAVGDVVRIESFELTFVLDRQPIGSEVSSPATAPSAASHIDAETRFSLAAPAAKEEEEAFALAPLSGDPVAPPELAPAADSPDAEDGFEVLPFAADPDAAADLPELDLVAEGPDELEEKQLEEDGMFAEAPAQLGTRSSKLIGSRPPEDHEPIRLDLALDASQLPERVRKALALLGEERLRIPATVTIEIAKPTK